MKFLRFVLLPVAKLLENEASNKIPEDCSPRVFFARMLLVKHHFDRKFTKNTRYDQIFINKSLILTFRSRNSIIFAVKLQNHSLYRWLNLENLTPKFGVFWTAVMLMYQVLGKLKMIIKQLRVIYPLFLTLLYICKFLGYLLVVSFLFRTFALAEQNSTPKGRVCPHFALNIPMWWARWGFFLLHTYAVPACRTETLPLLAEFVMGSRH